MQLSPYCLSYKQLVLCTGDTNLWVRDTAWTTFHFTNSTAMPSNSGHIPWPMNFCTDDTGLWADDIAQTQHDFIILLIVLKLITVLYFLHWVEICPWKIKTALSDCGSNTYSQLFGEYFFLVSIRTFQLFT